MDTTEQVVAILSGMDNGRLGICLGLGHLACAGEETAAALDRLRAAGPPVAKLAPPGRPGEGS